ncbi:MAG TPA: DUF3048 domain-containing protein [Candidatus Saccharimonadales bacterium]|nr:DUF3048 domain-containing protein [Candidatus Saccharimonadales bacterium]
MKVFAYLKEKFFALPAFKKAVVVGSLLILIGICAWTGYLIGAGKLGAINQTLFSKGEVISGVAEEPKDTPNPIDGVLFKKSETEAWIHRIPLAVMVENHTDARPQSGLSKAEVVYEALAEGGITRFMAVFLQEDTKMGPIRSARPYYLDWAVEYGAAYVHFGGSPDALDKINQYHIKDLNGLTIGPPTFERTSARPAPHNVYSTTDKLRGQADARGYKPETITLWKFLDDKEIPTRDKRPATFNIKLGFLGTYAYDDEWHYNPDSNSYVRFSQGKASIDAETNTQLEVKTVVVQTVSNYPDPSGHSRLQMNTVGSGDAKVFENGTVVEGTWKKDSRTSRTLFLDKNGTEIKLNRGKIWIAIIPPGSSFTYP